MKRPLKMALLLAAVVIVSLCYLTYNTYGNGPLLWRYEAKVIGFYFCWNRCGFSTISFQTVTQNHF